MKRFMVVFRDNCDEITYRYSKRQPAVDRYQELVEYANNANDGRKYHITIYDMAIMGVAYIDNDLKSDDSIVDV